MRRGVQSRPKIEIAPSIAAQITGARVIDARPGDRQTSFAATGSSLARGPGGGNPERRFVNSRRRSFNVQREVGESSARNARGSSLSRINRVTSFVESSASAAESREEQVDAGSIDGLFVSDNDEGDIEH